MTLNLKITLWDNTICFLVGNDASVYSVVSIISLHLIYDGLGNVTISSCKSSRTRTSVQTEWYLFTEDAHHDHNQLKTRAGTKACKCTLFRLNITLIYYH